jgi:hypothetical protein
VNLGAISTFHALASALFVGGTLLFGIATLRAGILPRLASGVFAFGLLLFLPVVASAGVPRLAAVPVGLALAWMGYALWSQRQQSSRERTPGEAALHPDQAAA